MLFAEEDPANSRTWWRGRERGSGDVQLRKPVLPIWLWGYIALFSATAWATHHAGLTEGPAAMIAIAVPIVWAIIWRKIKFERGL
jgi:hypothetical protein